MKMRLGIGREDDGRVSPGNELHSEEKDWYTSGACFGTVTI